MRNKELNNCIIIGIILTIAATVATFFFSAKGAIICLVQGVTINIIFFAFTKKRYGEIEKLNNYLTTIINGNNSLNIPCNQEGELSILQNNIYKTAKKLQNQTELLYKDKKWLADSLADISHQLKTPITSMMVMTDLLTENDLQPETRKEFLENINIQLTKMQWLIITLLKISKFDAGTVTLKKERISTDELIKRALKPFLVQAEIREISIDIKTDNSHFEGDYAWTQEALENIIKNCIEHMSPKGQLKITSKQSPLFTMIKIEDDGVGIEKDDLPHIFERFYKGKNSSSESVGIGLALSKSVFNRENAVIEVQSTVGIGTTFTIKFYKSII